MKSKNLQEILNGNIFTRDWFKRQRLVLGLICVLTFLYVYSGFAAQAQYRRMNDIKKELKDAQNTFSTKQAELIKLTRQSSLAEELRNRGSNLEENHVPVQRIN